MAIDRNVYLNSKKKDIEHSWFIQQDLLIENEEEQNIDKQDKDS